MTRYAASSREVRQLPAVSIVVVSYNGRRFLGKCLASVFQQDYPSYEVVLVDNASCDGTVEFVEHEFPQVRVIRNTTNLGFGQANNMGASRTTGECLAFLNQDTVVQPDWLTKLVAALEECRGAALATPKILVMTDPNTISACGIQTHYTGFTSCRGAGQPAQSFNKTEVVDAISGAAFVLKRSVFEEIGGFDGTFFLYMEDIDLSWRARLAGYKCLCVESSVVYHDHALTFGPQKTFYQERNRWLMLLKSLRWRSLLVLSPSLLLCELITWGWILIWDRPNVANKPRAYWWLLRNWRAVLQARGEVQARRRIRDRELIDQCQCRLAYDQVAKGSMVRAAQVMFDPLLAFARSLSAGVMRW